MLGLDLKTIAQATDLSINLVRQQVTADLALASRFTASRVNGQNRMINY